MDKILIRITLVLVVMIGLIAAVLVLDNKKCAYGQCVPVGVACGGSASAGYCPSELLLTCGGGILTAVATIDHSSEPSCTGGGGGGPTY